MRYLDAKLTFALTCMFGRKDKLLFHVVNTGVVSAKHDEVFVAYPHAGN